MSSRRGGQGQHHGSAWGQGVCSDTSSPAASTAKPTAIGLMTRTSSEAANIQTPKKGKKGKKKK